MDSVPVSVRNNHMMDKLRARRAKNAGADGSFTEVEWQALCASFGGFCLCCGSTEMLRADHVIPLCAGGSNTLENLQPLCNLCNTRKGTKTIDYRPAADGFTPVPTAPSPRYISDRRRLYARVNWVKMYEWPPYGDADGTVARYLLPIVEAMQGVCKSPG